MSIFGLLFLSFSLYTDFLTEQKQFERVRTAIRHKQELVETKLGENQFSPDNFHLLMIACKDIDLLEIYARKMQETAYTRVFSYRICSRSGQLGPKRKEGDRQVPEGFYHIDRFNPTSRFHLSLGLNYPNLSDKRKSIHHNLGDDIFIHGSCVTIGCLPMTDGYMEEIYLLVVHAKNNGNPKFLFTSSHLK
jgi:murein L,D-transpeptidase YafK